MAKAKRLPSGNWRVNLYVGKKPDGSRDYKSFTDPDKKTVEYLAAEYALTRSEKAKPMNMTVGEAIDRYIEARANLLSPGTVREYKRTRKGQLQAIIDVKLGDLTQEKVQLSINAEAIGHSPKTVRNAHCLLSAALREYHPTFALRTKLPQKVKHEIVVPERDEIQLIVREIAGTDLEIPVVLAACLGLRRSEICALTGSDLNRKKKTLTISKAMVFNEHKEWVIKAPKSYAGTRTLDVPQVIMDRLADAPTGSGRICACHPDHITALFTRLKKRLGLTLRFHDLRHYNASIMLALNVPDKYAMERLGQATPNMLKGVYQHVMKDKRTEVSTRVNDYMENLMQHEMQHERTPAQ